MNVHFIWQKFINEGDSFSFSVLYNTYVDLLYAYGIHLGFQDELCKDAIQDVFYKIYQSKNTLKKIKNPTAYLFKSYKYQLIDLARKEEKISDVDLSSIGDDFTIDITVSDKIIEAEELMLLKNKVEKMLKCLSGQQREALYLKYVLELKYNEISEILQINPDSVKKLIYRAMKMIRKNMGETT